MPIEKFEQIKKDVFAMLDGLDEHLTYHCKAHTADVLEQSERIALMEGINNEQELLLLKVAALYHDSGFLETYHNHESISCDIFLRDADKHGFTEEQKDIICGLIMATRVPQQPATHLQQIICDADLDYLGRDDFYIIGETLRREFLHYKIVADDHAWHTMQLKFLNNHHYHTASTRALREPVKQQHLQLLQAS